MTESVFHHLYGIMDGILLTIVCLLVLFAFKNYVSGQNLKITYTYLLLALSFLGFEGFNIFLQYSHQAPTMDFYPEWLVKLGGLTVPVSLSIMTYFYGHAMGLYSYKASRGVYRVRWMIRLIHLSLLAIFVTLLVSKDIVFMTRLIIMSFLLPCLSGAYIAWQSMGHKNMSKQITLVMILLVIGNLVMIWYSFGDRMLNKEILMLQVHLSYGALLIVICHILLSMGRDELNDVFKLYDLDAKRIIGDIVPGLINQEFSLHYQPQINLHTKAVSSMEALIRWQHPVKGNIPPNSFISIAEETGLIENITMWVIETSIKHTRYLLDHDYPLEVSINFSPNCFKMSIIEHLEKQLTRYAVPAHFVTIEITENMMIREDEPEVQAAFTRLQNIGIQLSIDDYGTGFSSLRYLKKMSIRELKIDQSFIADIQENKDNRTIVTSTLEMTKSLNIETVAEGVENEDVLNTLVSMGCDKAQGYGIAKPMPFDKLLDFLDNHPTK